MGQNHTPIDHLIDEHKKKADLTSVTITKEGEPIKINTEIKSEKPIEDVESSEKKESGELDKYISNEEEDFSLDPELKKAGLQIVDTQSLDPRHHIKLPIPDEKIIEGLDKPVNSSWRWIAEIGKFILRNAHISLKKIHGRVVRVMKR